MNYDRVYKQPIVDITRKLPMMDRTEFMEGILKIFRENQNYQVLGQKVDEYIKDFIGSDESPTVSVADNWDERD
jgi:hypothetical protein